MFLKNLLVILAIVSISFGRPTPMGEWPDDCVHQVPSDATLEYLHDGVMVHHPSIPSYFLEEKAHCVEHFKKVQNERLTQRKKSQNVPIPQSPDFWLDYADWTPTTPVGYFSGDYSVPQTPKSVDSQILYYFIGTENLDQSSQLSILQPVLTFSGKSNSFDPQGWSYASWNCCPSGQQHESTPISGFKTGDHLHGIIDKISSNSTWTVKSIYGTQTTTINVPIASRKFDWTDVTLEIYTVTGCSDFADGVATFSNMNMTDINGKTLTPAWKDVTGTTQCNGKVNIQSPTKVSISHN